MAVAVRASRRQAGSGGGGGGGGAREHWRQTSATKQVAFRIFGSEACLRVRAQRLEAGAATRREAGGAVRPASAALARSGELAESQQTCKGGRAAP